MRVPFEAMIGSQREVAEDQVLHHLLKTPSGMNCDRRRSEWCMVTWSQAAVLVINYFFLRGSIGIHHQTVELNGDFTNKIMWVIKLDLEVLRFQRVETWFESFCNPQSKSLNLYFP